MAGPPGAARRQRHDRGQHFLANAALATRLVRDAEIGADDRVVEFGAGHGILTDALARRGAHVIAVELAPTMVAGLAERFVATPTVTVVPGDAAEVALPATPYRVVSNPPFHRTAALLRRILDPNGGLVRGHVVVQWQVARARSQAGVDAPLDLLGATWAPWWGFERGRRLPAALFRPPPSVDAAVLVITRRHPPLLPPATYQEYGSWVRRAFRDGIQPALDAAAPRRGVERLARTLGVTSTTTPTALRVEQWVQLFRLHRERG